VILPVREGARHQRGDQISEQLWVRVGIGTREIVVGDLIISGDGQERGVAGGTPKLAARLQPLAEGSKLVIAPLNGPAAGRQAAWFSRQ
jgi:class 3 adenylate cyclase